MKNPAMVSSKKQKFVNLFSNLLSTVANVYLKMLKLKFSFNIFKYTLATETQERLP